VIKAFAVALLVALVVAASQAAVPAAGDAAAAAPERRILVMLALAAPHSDSGAAADAKALRAGRRAVASRLASEHGLVVESDWVMASLGVDCFLMTVAGGYAPADVLRDLALDARVVWAQPLHAFRTVGHNDPLFGMQPAAGQWHLEEVHALTTGRNVSIAQLDSGVESTHPDLAGQVSIAENFVDGSAYVAEAHGTAVAGIIAARADNGVGIAGVAPEARLMALRACWQVDSGAASCNTFTLAKAFQFALGRRADVINLSLTGPDDELLRRLLDAALGQGVIVVAAADPHADGGGFPASHPGVIAVVQDGANVRFPALAAPGEDVPTTLPGNRWGFVSGTSFAAAHISGMAALLRELAPTLGPQQARTLLRSTAEREPASAGAAHRIDACAVITGLAGVCACACPASAATTSSRR